MKFLILFLILIFSLFSCRSKSAPENEAQQTGLTVIDFEACKIEEQPLKLSEIADSIAYIPLETHPQGMIGNIVTIYGSDSLIVVKWGGQLATFTSSGQFIACMPPSGRGPGEGFARCFGVDLRNKRVYIFENYTYKLQCFTYQGKWLGDVEQAWKNFDAGETYDLFASDNRLFVIMPVHPVKKRNWFSYGFDVLTKEIAHAYPNNYELPEVYRERRYDHVMTHCSVFYQEYGDSLVLFHNDWNDTLYQTTDFKEIIPRFVLKYPNRESYQDMLRLLIRDRQLAIRYAKNYTYSGVWETSRFVWVQSHRYDGKRRLLLYDKKENHARIFSSRVVRNDLDGGPDFVAYPYIRSRWIYRNKMYYLIWPSEWEKLKESDTEKSVRVREICATLAADANPVLMVVSLKQN